MTKTCPDCRNENKSTSKFCEKCGTTLSDMERTRITNKITKSKSGGIMNWWNKQGNGVKIGSIIGACCLGLILIVGIGGMLSPDATTSNSSVDTTSTVSEPTTTASTTPSDSNVKKFSNKYMSFEYPKDWKIEDFNQTVHVVQNEYNSIEIDQFSTKSEYTRDMEDWEDFIGVPGVESVGTDNIKYTIYTFQDRYYLRILLF